MTRIGAVTLKANPLGALVYDCLIVEDGHHERAVFRAADPAYLRFERTTYPAIWDAAMAARRNQGALT